MDVLPQILPVFPLSGALLLPGGRLPLHVFEQRYRNLVEDALDGDYAIGIIQPCRGQPEVQLEIGEGGESEPPELYGVGCAGLIERSERLRDGRYIILLRGVRRFRVERELPTSRGYRQVVADYEGFAVDSRDIEAEVEPDRLMDRLRHFAEVHQVPLELDRLRELSGLALLNSVAMALPFAAAEKQALLEAPDVRQRHEMLLTLLDMGLELRSDVPPPLLN